TAMSPFPSDPAGAEHVVGDLLGTVAEHVPPVQRLAVHVDVPSTIRDVCPPALYGPRCGVWVRVAATGQHALHGGPRRRRPCLANRDATPVPGGGKRRRVCWA